MRHACAATRSIPALLSAVLVTGLAATAPVAAAAQDADRPAFRFRTGVDLINVSATVTDRRGRFVSGLDKDDFLVYEDGVPQTLTHFSRERVPVSLGIVLDTSGSMEGERMAAARSALDRFLFDLLGPDDEFFLYRFNYQPRLVHDWTNDPERVSRALGGIRPRGGTALYDAVADAVMLAEQGRHRKKAVVVISDGNDTNSEIRVRDLQRLIRETEVMVYAVGIDSPGPSRSRGGRPPAPRTRPPVRVPFPIPGGGGRGRLPIPPTTRAPGGGVVFGAIDRVNASALRDLTDDSGGRTEVIRGAGDLAAATAGIADELSRQYFLAYPAPGHADGRWHEIEVEIRDSRYRVRARRGYIATP
ncbi:MAG: VWA domain-containing protein [Acidobacteria bacterium]|nr:VWA domain-containing protein [Acidobacteriota bacterium]